MSLESIKQREEGDVGKRPQFSVPNSCDPLVHRVELWKVCEEGDPPGKEAFFVPAVRNTLKAKRVLFWNRRDKS